MNEADQLAMAEEWVCVEDVPEVINADVDDMIEAMENNKEEVRKKKNDRWLNGRQLNALSNEPLV